MYFDHRRYNDVVTFQYHLHHRLPPIGHQKCPTDPPTPISSLKLLREVDYSNISPCCHPTDRRPVIVSITASPTPSCSPTIWPQTLLSCNIILEGYHGNWSDHCLDRNTYIVKVHERISSIWCGLDIHGTHWSPSTDKITSTDYPCSPLWLLTSLSDHHSWPACFTNYSLQLLLCT